MNPKKAAPLIVTLPALVEIVAAAPPLIIGGAIVVGSIYFLKWLLSDDEKKPESVPTSAPSAPERPALRPLISAGNSAQNRISPSHSGGISNVTQHTPAAPPVMASTPSGPSVSVSIPSAIPAMKIAPQVPLPQPSKRKFVTREDVADAFQHGARAQTRTAAVAALKRLGFGKTAAYDALLENGKFSAWLQFAPDGIITWTE